MSRTRARLSYASLVALLALGTVSCTVVEPKGHALRVATFNLALNRRTADGLSQELIDPESTQLHALTGIIQTVRPDILVLNEFDYDGTGESLKRFADQWLKKSGAHSAAIDYPERFSAPVNTGSPSGFDLDRDGKIGSPGDGFGFGAFPGQYGMALLSRYPILHDRVRSFQTFLWRDMPGALIPEGYYSEAELAKFRLSSKSHWDIPVQVGDAIVHLLLCHPTPPVFDGPEDRNGRRNHDEIRFFADYIDPARAGYIYDDAGEKGGLKAGALFVICGDMNADPQDGDSTERAIHQLLDHPSISPDVPPQSAGARVMAETQAGKNGSHRGPHAHDTGDFNDKSVGNLRLDYVLPSTTLERLPQSQPGVFWPAPGTAAFERWIGPGYPPISSDHRCVWVDLRLKP